MNVRFVKREGAIAQTCLIVAAVGLTGWQPAFGLIVTALWLLPIILTIGLGQSRGRSGWMWGFFLGWLGVLILAVMSPQPQRV